MSGLEKAPTAPRDGGTPDAVAAREAALKNFNEKNGTLQPWLVMSTSDGPDGFSRPGSQVVQSHGPVGEAVFRDGHAAYIRPMKASPTDP